MVGKMEHAVNCFPCLPKKEVCLHVLRGFSPRLALLGPKYPQL